MPQTQGVAYPKTFATLSNFGGGLNTNYPLLDLADNESPNLQNVLFDRFGNMEKVRGIAKVNTIEIAAGKPIYGFAAYYNSQTGVRQILCMCDTSIWKLTGSTWSTVKTTLTANEYIQSINFVQKLIIVKKSMTPQKWDGNTMADLAGSPPTGQYICDKVHRVFIAGNTTYPNRLYFSDFGNYDSWDVNGYLDIFPGRGDVITNIQTTIEGILIYTEHCIYMLYTRDSSNPEAWLLRQFTDFNGCYAPYSLVQVPTKSNTLFLGENGAFTLEGVIDREVGLISDKITNYIDSISLANRQKGWGSSFDYKWWLSFPNNKILVYDYVLNSWTRLIGINANCTIPFKKDDSTPEKLYIGSATNGYVYIYGDNDDFDGAVIDAFYYTKPFETDNLLQQQEYWTANVVVENQSSNYNITFGFNIDFGSQYTDANINVYDSDSNKKFLIRPANMRSERGTFIQYRFMNDEANQYFKVYQAIIELTQKRYHKKRG